jgi:hypothetical protein
MFRTVRNKVVGSSLLAVSWHYHIKQDTVPTEWNSFLRHQNDLLPYYIQVFVQISPFQKKHSAYVVLLSFLLSFSYLTYLKHLKPYLLIYNWSEINCTYFKVYTLMFTKHIHLLNDGHNQENEHIHHPKSFFHTHF